MVTVGSFLDTGDKVASIVGGAAALAALWFARRRFFRRKPDDGLSVLLSAQLTDARRHRYRFFGEHVPALTDLYVRSRATLEGATPRTVAAVRILDAHRHAVLLGDAGAGKSTFLATVAGELAGQAIRRRGGGDIAVILPAGDLVGRRLPEALARATDLPPAVFEKAPPGGSWRVLIDGLDEVVAPESRSEVLWRIRGLLADPGPYRLIVTCRPLAAPELAELHGPGVGIYDLRPFDRRELDEFARRWFAARFPADRRRAERTAGRFLARVAGARLGPVARVPLLATIAALVYESADDRTLPSSRAALYDRFVDHLLDGRRSLDRFREAVEPELLTRGPAGAAVAAWLCADIHRHVGGLLRACGAAWLTDPEVRLTEVAAEWMARNAPHDLGPDRDRLVRELLLVTGVCTMRRDRVVFAHQSFAEYFGAYYEPGLWAQWAADPATRSLAAFAAAGRPDADALIAGLLDGGDPIAAGDLVADGIPALPATRERVVGLLLHEVAAENEAAPEALRILGELSLDAEVLERMADVARSPEASWWTRALVADRIADVDVATGHDLLRAVARQADEVVRAWIADTLHERGGRVDPNLRVPLAADTVPANRSLGTLARQALTQRLADARASDAERFAAAVQLADGGDLAPLRAMAEATDLDPYQRVRLAGSLADAGEPGLLRELSETGPSHIRYAAALELFHRADPAAGPALSAVADDHPGRPMAFGAAARCAELGDRGPLSRLAGRPGQVQLRLSAARRLAALGDGRALRQLLDEPLAPDIEATALASLIEAGETDVAPRLRRLLRGRGVRSYRHIQLRYLLAGLGDGQSREWLRRKAGHGVIEAAVALTVLSDPYGPDRLRAIAGGPGVEPPRPDARGDRPPRGPAGRRPRRADPAGRARGGNDAAASRGHGRAERRWRGRPADRPRLRHRRAGEAADGRGRSVGKLPHRPRPPDRSRPGGDDAVPDPHRGRDGAAD